MVSSFFLLASFESSIYCIFNRVKVDGFLVQISVGDKSHVWGVNRADNIYYRTNGDINGTWIQG